MIYPEAEAVAEREFRTSAPCPFLLISEREGDRNAWAWMRAVIQVVPVIGVIEIYVIGVVPSGRPRFGPRIHEWAQ